MNPRGPSIALELRINHSFRNFLLRLKDASLLCLITLTASDVVLRVEAVLSSRAPSLTRVAARSCNHHTELISHPLAVASSSAATGASRQPSRPGCCGTAGLPVRSPKLCRQEPLLASHGPQVGRQCQLLWPIQRGLLSRRRLGNQHWCEQRRRWHWRAADTGQALEKGMMLRSGTQELLGRGQDAEPRTQQHSHLLLHA